MSFSQGFNVGMRWREQKRSQDQEDAMKAELKAISEAAPETFTIQPATPNDDGGVPLDSASGVRFMGKAYTQAPTDAEMSSARNAAMAGVVKKYDPVKGMQMEQSSAVADREATRFGREKKGWERQDKDQAREDEWQAGRRKIMEDSPYAQVERKYAQDTADYQTKLQAWEQAKSATGMESRDAAELGPPPVQPKRASMTPGQMALSYAQLIDHDAKFGKLNTEGFINFGEKLQSLRKEGYADAVKALNSGASIDDVAKAFNAGGDAKFDPALVVSDQIVKGSDGVPSRVVTYKDEKGAVHTINAVQELDALGQADKIYNRFYQGKQDKRADHAEKRADAQLAVSQAAGGRAQAEFDAEGPQRQLKSTLATLQLALGNTDDPTERANIQSKISAIQTGVGANKDQPAEVKLAQAMMSAGMASDMKSALEMAISKKGMSSDEIHKEFVTAGIKNMKPAADAVADADATMAAMGYTKGSGGRWAQSAAASTPVAKYSSEADAEAAAKAGKLKPGDKVQINGRTATYKP